MNDTFSLNILMAALKGALLVSMLALTHVALANEDYDHFEHGFDLDGAHQFVECESCHRTGVFQGTPRDCQVCHDGSGLYAKSAASFGHIPTTEFCDSCHTTSDWASIVEVDHAQVIGRCSSCHNNTGLFAQGTPTNHIQTNAECDLCHTDFAFLPALFNHDDINSGCITCHNGSDATGKSQAHIITTDVCEDCHTVDFWAPVIRVDHTQVIGSCFSCHNGVTATGKNMGHIASGDNCDDCHSTAAWLPAVFDHASVSPGTCSSCHNGTTATGQNQGHFITIAECDDCHTRDFWLPSIFAHSTLAFEPLDHRGNFDCTECHTGNSEVVAWETPIYQPDCAGCHFDTYRPGVDDHNGIDLDRDCSGSGCHSISDNEW